ncbi:substrate-binding periplasmic protein [Pseudomonadota bacterium]
MNLISTEIPNGLFERDGSGYVGALATLFEEASKRSGVSINYRIVPWVRAVKETESSDNLILFPFTRTAEREDRFTWITPLKEDDMCFASSDMRIDTLDEARHLTRIIVWRGTSQQSFLESHNFKNLITVSNIERIIQVLKASPEAAWYYICDEAQSYIDPEKKHFTLILGKPVAREATWLASGRAFKPTPETQRFTQAINELRGENFLTDLLSKIKK